MDSNLKRIIAENNSALESSKMNFQTLYTIMFANSGVIAEDNNGVSINEYTYADVRNRIEEVSCALHERIGATGGFVGLEMENSIDWIVAFWAILRSGNKPYLINCRHPESLANSALKTLGIRYIVGNGESRLDGEFIDIKTLTTANRFDGVFEDEIALSTSATSLKETICFYGGKEIATQILNMKGFIREYPEIAKKHNGRIKNLAFLPFYHIFGLIAVYFWFTFFGQTVVFMKNYSSDTILKTCKKHGVTHIFAVPLLWHTIENAVMKKAKEGGEKKVRKLRKGVKICTSIQNIFPRLGMKIAQKIMGEVTEQLFGNTLCFCISGGSYIRQSALELINGLGYNLHNGYGMSEIGITSVELRTRPKHKNLNSIGKPFDSVEYKIDENGILNVKGSSICSKLWINGEPQEMDGWFCTGDNMEMRDGYYYIKGRVGDMIIGENGENINPDVIEQNFDLPEAENFCILGLETEGRKTVSMIVQLGRYMSTQKKNDLLDKITETNKSLPITSRVQKIYCTCDNLCAATAVKVSRSYVLRAVANGDITLAEYKKDVSVGETEADYSPELLKDVTEIVAKALDIPAESIDANANIMIDLGADSMQYFSILTAIAEKFSVSSSEKTISSYTVHEICQYLERHI
ncbi:MAG: non-ribosomal peptide synthetase [Clostridia bacterium]|nr:non-ribosomal peptide synthetase [Clostridia bacterium]